MSNLSKMLCLSLGAFVKQRGLTAVVYCIYFENIAVEDMLF